MNTIYYHSSIVNGVTLYRVWMDGNKVGEFATEGEAIGLYSWLLVVKSERFKTAIQEAYLAGRISMLKQNGLLADQYWEKTYE
jgi:hypothetical protein